MLDPSGRDRHGTKARLGAPAAPKPHGTPGLVARPKRTQAETRCRKTPKGETKAEVKKWVRVTSQKQRLGTPKGRPHRDLGSRRPNASRLAPAPALSPRTPPTPSSAAHRPSPPLLPPRPHSNLAADPDAPLVGSMHCRAQQTHREPRPQPDRSGPRSRSRPARPTARGPAAASSAAPSRRFERPKKKTNRKTESDARPRSSLNSLLATPRGAQRRACETRRARAPLCPLAGVQAARPRRLS